jgi:hypothetical protein
MSNNTRSRLVAVLLGLGTVYGCDSDTTALTDAGGADHPSSGEARPPDGALDRSGGEAVVPDGRAAADAPFDAPCTPATCSGVCGLVPDPCTGQQLSCGGCPTGEVCNVETHSCTKALVTCTDLAADCGIIKNSCGKHISCGACLSGKECDPDTNTCVACQQVTCQDLGYECGKAWLGCGDPATALTDCGTCAAGKVCNPSLNLCEPACTPLADADVCAAAKTASGIECGLTTNGCGGVSNCGGCPAGKGCGIYGVANRCETILFPDECLILGKNCGQIDSACGGKVDCGTCSTGQVCNPNNVCGTPCKPKVCADFAPAECGAFDDGCNGTVTCACSTAGAICKTDHTCCVDTSSCPAKSCDTTVQNTCTGGPKSCNTCATNEVCDKTAKTCVPKKTCATYGAGGTAPKCSDSAIYDDGAGTKFACPCTKPDWLCVDLTAPKLAPPGTEGKCCKSVNPGCPSSGPGSCGSWFNECINQTIQCTCPPNYYCNGDTCVPNDTCAKFTANGNAGNPCSNGASPSFPNGAGTNLSCPCKTGLACLDAPPTTGKVVAGSTPGTCYLKKKCSDYTANGNLGQTCSTGPSFSDDAGVLLTCACTPAYACADTQDKVVTGAVRGMCKLKKTCGDWLATGAIGAPCNPNKSFSDGYGGTFACPCSTTGAFNPGGLGNNKCVGATATVAGTCQCAPTVCTCANSGLTNGGCGGAALLSCPCPTGQTCNKTAGLCCPAYSCASLPPGIPAGSCGTIADTCMAANLTCACDTTTKPNNKCVITTGTYGTCVCTALTCLDFPGQTGQFDDRCGGTVNCGG